MVHRTVNPKPRRRGFSQLSNRAVAHDQLSDAMSGQLGAAHPDKLDARLLRIAGVCVLASVMTILDATVVSVAQRTFILDFDSTQAIVAWTMTAYTLALATVIPLAGWAADRFGTKRLFIGSVFFFTLGSLLCAMAPSITMLIAFRMVQGLGGGMLMPLMFTILTREAGPSRLGRLMAVLGVPMLLGPISGPILGGWLIDSYSWPWIFLINLPVGLAAMVLATIIFPKDRPTPSESFDVTGMLLLSPGLAAFLYGVSSIPGRGTVADKHVWVPVLIGLLLITGFVYHALCRAEHPLIDLRLFGNRVLTMANATMFLFAIAFFGSALLIPSYFQQVLGHTPLQSGVHLIPQGLGAVLTMPIAGQIMDRRGPGRVVLVGITLIAIGLGTFGYSVWQQHPYLPIMLLGLLVMGMGMGCTMMPVAGAAVQTLRPHEVARGSTLINVNQQVAGSIGTALMSVILTNQFNRSGNITIAGQMAAIHEQAARSGQPPDLTQIPPQALAPDFMSDVVHDLSHAYTVVFFVAVGFVLLTLLPAWFLPKKPAQTAPGQTPVPVTA